MSRLMRWALAGVSAIAVAMFGYVVARRLFYPLELDCIEGVILDHVLRLTAGKPMYAAPSLQFVSLAYMPLYMIVSSWFVQLTGPAFWVPRLISFTSTWGIALLIAATVRRETGARAIALGGAAIYLLGFGYTGSCYDVARPDSMMLFLALAGLFALRFTRSVIGAMGAALLLSFAFLTKQHGLLLGLAALVHLVFNDRRRLLPYLLVLALGCGGGYWLLARTQGPWFTFYTWDVPRHWSQPSALRLMHYVGDSLVGTLGVLFVSWLLSLGLPPRPWKGPGGLWTWVMVGALGTGALATLDPYAYRHTLMPTLMMLCIAGPIALHRIAMAAVEIRAESRSSAMAVVCGVLALQFLPLMYPLHSRLPHPRALEANVAFMRELRSLPGSVVMPFHGYYERAAGKAGSLHIIALDDVLRSHGNSLLRRDPDYFNRMFEPLRHGPNRPALITDVPLDRFGDEEASGPLWKSLSASYHLKAELGWIADALRPVTGNPFSPTFVYVPVDSRASSRDSLTSSQAAGTDAASDTSAAGPEVAPHGGAGVGRAAGAPLR